MNQKTKDLEVFYDNNSDKFHGTRKKHWPEFDYILEEINNYPKDGIKILEFGCGSGRLLKYLTENSTKKIEYIGIDISQNLINIAQTENPNGTFIKTNMIEFIETFNQQEFDFVIGIASFQHIPTINERMFFLKNVYRILKYDGKLMMTNWSFSKRFIKKYWLAILSSIGEFIMTLGIHKINDLNVPFQNGDIIYQRYYHIFFLSELKKLCKLAGFIIQSSKFIDKNGKLKNDCLESRNSFIVAEKKVMIG